MNAKLFVCLLLALGLSAMPVTASDICTTAGRAVTMSAEQMDNFNDDHIQGNIFFGSGTIKRTKHNEVDSDQAYTITVDCGNKVLMILYADEMFGKSHQIEEGATISFYGKATKIKTDDPEGATVFLKVIE